MILFACPVCKTALQVPDEQGGTKVACSKCGQRLKVPDTDPNKTLLGERLPPRLNLGVSAGPRLPPVESSDPPSLPALFPLPNRHQLQWYYMHNGVKHGPVTWTDLEKMAANNKLEPVDPVWTRTMGQWLPAERAKVPFPGKRLGEVTTGAKKTLARWKQSVYFWPVVGAAGAVAVVGLVVLVVLLVIPRDSDRSAQQLQASAPDKKPEQEKPSPPKELKSDEIFAHSVSAVALIKTPMGTGTGFLVRPGVLATNAHVIEMAAVNNLKVYFPSDEKGKDIAYDVDYVLSCNFKRDLAFLSVPKRAKVPPLKVARNYEFKPGRKVTVIGNPGLGGGVILENAVAEGVMSTRTTLQGESFYQLSIGINPGNSGGPAFDSFGEVIGVITLKALDKEGLAFCIPVDDLQKGLQAVDKQTVPEKKTQKSRYNAQVAFRRTYWASDLYLSGTDLIRKQWADALAKFGNVVPEDLRNAQKLFFASLKLKKLDRFLLMDDVYALVNELGTDELLTEETRQKLAELRNNYEAIKDLFNNPGNNLKTYFDRCKQHSNTLRELVASLRGALGLQPEELTLRL
jgi:S1-C subfamily serine protease